MNKSFKDSIIIGLALFATYFGAGNLVFPPALGLEGGSQWVPSIVGLTTSGILLPIIGIIVISYAGGSVEKLTAPISKKFYTYILFSIMVFASLISIPRTAAVGAELGVQGMFPDIPTPVIVVIYFGLTYYFASNKESVIDKVGKMLTPVLTILLVAIVIKGFITPVGTPVDTGLSNPFVNSFLGGYQTGDLLVSFMMANIFIGDIINKGYKSDLERNRVTVSASLIAFLCLSVVYGGLLFLGASGSGQFTQGTERAVLLVGLVRHVMGGFGVAALGIAVILACLTTAIGQVSAVSDFFEEISHGKIKYKFIAAVVSTIGTLIALMGLDKIVVISTPMFLLMYPTCMVVILLGVFRKLIPRDGSYKGAVIATLIYSLLEAFLSTGIKVGFVEKFVNIMPLSSQGFGWFLPAIIGFIIGTVVLRNTNTNEIA